MLDSRYSSFMAFIKANQSQVTFTFTNVDLSYNSGFNNGTGGRCTKITYSN